MTLSIFDTGEVTILDPPTERLSFALPSDSTGEVPLLNWAAVPTVTGPGEQTERITIPVTYGTATEPAEPPRPRFFRGTRRWTRSRALLVAATWPGGVR